MKGKIKLLIAGLSLAAAAAVSVGATYAIVTSDNSSHGTLATGNVSLTSRAANVRVYSAVPASAGDSGVFYDENNSPYKYEQSTVQGDLQTIYFSRHKGSVTYDDKSIRINNIMPGDKVEFDIAVTSTSTISFNYRAELYVDASAGQNLLNQLDFSAGKLGLLRQSVPEDIKSDESLAPAVLTDYTEWKTFSGNQSSIENIHVTVAMPVTATKGQGETVKFYYVASGVQNVEAQPDVAEIEVDGEKFTFKTLADAVNYAAETGAGDIRVINSTVLEEGAVTIGNSLKITGVADEKGNLPEIKGARISVVDGAAVTFENLKFGGTSYVDVSDSTALTLIGCVAEINAVKFFDTADRSYLSDAAFIVSGVSPTANRLVIRDSTINAVNGAAVSLRSRLQNGSAIYCNSIGSAANSYNGTAALVLNGAEDGAIVKVYDNTVYADAVISLGGTRESARFTVFSENNTACTKANGKFALGTANGAFIDSGSKLNGKALSVTDIAHEGLLFGGVDVVWDSLQRISAGKLVISENINYTDFFLRYVSAGTVERNALALYSDGELIGYINSSDNELGYTIDYLVK